MSSEAGQSWSGGWTEVSAGDAQGWIQARLGERGQARGQYGERERDRECAQGTDGNTGPGI